MRTNIPELEQGVRAFGRQAVFAAAVSLTRAAKDAQAAVRDEMRSTFDRPTAYALNGLMLQGATKAKLQAKVWVKDNPFGKGTPADRFLLPHIHGGPRGQKGMDRALQAAGMLPAGWTTVPAAGAQLDNYGNVRRGQITQILSQLRVQLRGGYESRASGSAASRRTVARQGVTYFALAQADRGLQAGIYLKRKFAQGTAIRPVFIFVPVAQYQKRLRFFEVGQAVAEHRFGVHFRDELARAVVSARVRP